MQRQRIQTFIFPPIKRVFNFSIFFFTFITFMLPDSTLNMSQQKGFYLRQVLSKVTDVD